MQKPKPVIVGDLVAHPQRPPTSRDDRWYWQCRVYDPGTQKQRTAWSGRGTRDEVEDALVQARDRVLAPVVRIEVGPLRSVSDLLDAWFSTAVHGARKQTTERTYRYDAKRIAAYLGDKLLMHVTSASLEQTQRVMLRDFSPWSVHTSFSVLRTAWRWGIALGVVRAVCPRFPRRQAHRVSDGYTPTMDEVWRVIDSLAHAPGAHSTLVLLAQTGARPSEIVRLVNADVEIGEANVVVFLGRHAGGQKTGARRVPIFDAAADLVRRLHDPQPGAARTRLIKRHDGAPISESFARNLAGTLRSLDWDAIGSRRFTPYGLRRAAVDQFARSGVSPADAAAITGHSVATMLTKYRQVTERDKALAMQRAGIGRRPGDSRVVNLRRD